MKLIIQIPCYNEAATLWRVIADLPTALPGIESIETLVIDDGSTDGTAAIAAELGVNHVVRHSRNRGLAATFSTGLAACLDLGADLIINTDGDHQYPGDAIADLVDLILNEGCDIAIGDRQPVTDHRIPIAKRVLHRLGRWVVRGLAGQDLPDPVSGFRAFRRSAAAKMHIVTGYTYTIESLIQATNRGLKIGFVPIATNPPTRPSRLFRSIPQFVIRSAVTLLRVFFMFHPLQVLVYVSAALGCIGVLPIVRFLWFYAIGAGDGHVQSLILGVALIFLSALTLVAGLIADLISHNRQLIEKVIELQRSDRDGKQSAVHSGHQFVSVETRYAADPVP